MSGVEVLFIGFGALTVSAGILAVSSRQVVHAALWLVVALGALAARLTLDGRWTDPALDASRFAW